MPGRTSVVSMLWLTSALALLAGVLFVDVPTSGVVTVSSRIDGPRYDSSQNTTGVSEAMATDAALKGNVLPIEQDENEEQDQDEVLVGPRISFLILCGLQKLPARQLIAPHSVLSLYHLRC